jgi:hypothetical protein
VTTAHPRRDGGAGTALAAETPGTPDPSAGGRGEPISPELVLVSPQLRLKALAALPDRPWEAFLRPPVEEEPPAAASPAPVEVRAPAVAESPAAAAPVIDGRRPPLRSVTLVVAGVILGLVLAEFLPHPAGPRLVETVTQASPAPAQRAPATPAPKPKPNRQPQPPPRTKKAPPARGVVPVPGAGYVFGPHGHFRVSGNLGAIKSFTARVKCASTITIATVPLRAGRFVYHGTVRAARGTVRIDLSGRFLDRNRASGTVRARSGRCRSGNVPFVASLS